MPSRISPRNSVEIFTQATWTSYASSAMASSPIYGFESPHGTPVYRFVTNNRERKNSDLSDLLLPEKDQPEKNHAYERAPQF